MNPPKQSDSTGSEARLSAYLDGELPDADRQQVESEIAASAQAQGELQNLKEVSTLLRTWDATVQEAHPSQQFKAFIATGGQSVSAELRAQAAEEDDIPVAPVVRKSEKSPAWMWVVVALLAVLAVALIWHGVRA
ncbi:MAG TPA: zf-HC2 domain-containing protein [Planctomycetota bacterium]|nr:zf-HC2 domain-containing protein [Planctomycetota bacterium]